MVIWKDTPVVIRDKAFHRTGTKGKKANGKIGIVNISGAIPVARFNEVTGAFEVVVNNRGLAYAKRRDMMFRRTKNLD